LGFPKKLSFYFENEKNEKKKQVTWQKKIEKGLRFMEESN
jgi:hypothetical protein